MDEVEKRGMVGKEEIKAWIKSGKESGYHYLIVACDTFDYEDYPIFIKDKVEVDRRIGELDQRSMQDYHHVFDLSIEDYEESRKKFWLDRANNA